MEQIIEVAKRLRTTERFNGYIHLKGVAGATAELLAKAGLYADRVSANVELPTQASLDRFAPGKSQLNIFSAFKAIDTKIQEGKEKTISGRRNAGVRVSGQSTQIVVGPGDHTDLDILNFTSDAYKSHRLNRVYYSAYTPVPGADRRLPVKQVPLERENRLYQADWLLRFYGFNVKELVEPERKNLELDRDPKMSWALRNLALFPVDVNRCSREELLRVPGLGLKTVDTILSARQHRSLRVSHLEKTIKRWKQVRHFLITADHNPDAGNFATFARERKPAFVQPSLFSDTV
jgi:predicted DNA-binding helix-hairpin-helix protein